MSTLLMLHILSAILCIALIPALFVHALKGQSSFTNTASVFFALSLVATGIGLSAQNSLATLPVFCAQASSLFLVMYVSNALGRHFGRKNKPIS